ncbi:hypothetical protein [Algibacter sp. R77976]|uniref:hypothetical protein n=1 Tax=Algibacter sp. R77976 TaxID=3093873 RepID=UPI0037C6DEFF
MKNREKLLVLIPALWASLFDIVITIVHQPKGYWNGDLNIANEANPIGNFMMKYHVSGIFIISILWLVIIAILGYYLPRKVARVFLLFTLMIHSWGASTWISNYYSFWLVIVFILFNSILYLKMEGYLKN